MDYISKLTELNVKFNIEYPANDIGISRLFFDLHREKHRYVTESKSWYVYDGRRWVKDSDGARTMEQCKEFAQGYHAYLITVCPDEAEDKVLLKFAAGLAGRKKREGILKDAQSIEPLNLSAFDRDPMVFNCLNGTFDLQKMMLRPHSSEDFITKMTKADYVEGAVCQRWEQFINEVMCGDKDTMKFLQKALGYSLSGDTSHECFFILYGSTTRNGKSTLTETIVHMLDDYARTIQPQTLSRRRNDGASPTPDTARLRGARLVNASEPDKGLELNAALIKQLTGGETYTARFLHENPVEFKPEFKIFINTNHLPRTDDDTVFASGRVKLIPFERHFKSEERDRGLKKLFCKSVNMSGILNWLIEGYRLLLAEGFLLTARMEQVVSAYREAGNKLYDFSSFINETLTPAEGQRTKTSVLYSHYRVWAHDNGWEIMSSQSFVGELRKRFIIKPHCTLGNTVIGYKLKRN